MSRHSDVESKQEREEHEKTNIPYRRWCRACVRGRRKNKTHKKKTEGEKKEERERGVPRISMDYHFMSKADEEAKVNPMLVVVNEQTGDKYARAAGKKGIGSEGGAGLVNQRRRRGDEGVGTLRRHGR